MDSIVYLHLHQTSLFYYFNSYLIFLDEEEPATIVLINKEGVQESAFEFPTAQACLTFLTCLENGLLPFYCLDPRLIYEEGKGYYFYFNSKNF